MKKFKNIVVGTDFSESATVAFLYAQHIAAKFGADIQIIHVFQPIIDTAEHITYSSSLDELYKEYVLKLAQFVEQTTVNEDDESVAVATKTKVIQRVIMGLPTDIFIKMSEDPSVDLLILGTVGEHAWYDKIFGSVAVNVAHGAYCPVLLIPKNTVSYTIQAILYASSLDSASPAAVETAIDWAKKFDATMHFVHVTVFENNKSEELFKIIMTEKAPKLTYTIENQFANSVKEGIYTFARDRGVDMIIAYTHHYSFIENLIRFSVSKDLAWHTRLPILFIHNNL